MNVLFWLIVIAAVLVVACGMWWHAGQLRQAETTRAHFGNAYDEAVERCGRDEPKAIAQLWKQESAGLTASHQIPPSLTYPPIKAGRQAQRAG